MTKLNTTPGDWVYDRASGRLQLGIDGDTICHIIFYGMDGEELDASGYLMASAPDLYEACELLLIEMRSYTGQPFADAEVIELAEKALKKARGEQA